MLFFTKNDETMNTRHSKIILIAEDNDDSRQMLRTFIEMLGYEVIEARDGEEAINLASSSRPDLILMDLNMPKIDGLTAAAHIRSQPDLCEIPILANSADGSRGIELFSNIEKFGEGHIDYIPKPISFDELTYQIDLILGNEQKKILNFKSAIV